MQNHPNGQVNDIDNEKLEQGEEEEVAEIIPPRKINWLLWTIIILVIIGFAIFGVTTLQHHPPLPSNTTGSLYHLMASAAIILPY
ncbi:hypothetical protein [Dictyobacter formicarum]|uniref:Uncharacterized protein n=1 Tax=Dictyobacter formicarum TaxID=2778368 RepID=A0ABQ3VHP0_9CHLR|nr:hypothetical protein [Dictyobacter formicarum]GHO85305.1 hypothetical protein KSZ_33110 [Dictyobacter formicarum]